MAKRGWFTIDEDEDELKNVPLGSCKRTTMEWEAFPLV
jgi:hypothetical protein